MREQKDQRCLRPAPCPAYDVEGTESWLSDLAAKGLFLTEDGFFAGFGIFRRGTPKRVWYRLEASPDPLGLLSDSYKPDDEAEALHQEFGWTYVASRGQFYIYCSPHPVEREPNTDPQVQALALEMVCKRQRGALAGCVFWTILYPILRIGRSPLLLLIGCGTWFLLWGMALLLLGLLRSLRELIHLTRLRRRLTAGGTLNHRKNWRRHARLYPFCRILLPLLTVLWLALFLQRWSDAAMDKNKIPLAAFTGEVPFATIADFAPEGRYALTDYGFSNTVQVRSDYLAPTAIHWAEIATVSLPEGGTISGGLYVDYYETRSPALAEEIAQEYLSMDRREKNYAPLEAPPLGVDFTAAYLDEAHMPTVVLQQGSRVCKATFYQTGSVELPMDQWAAALAGSLQQAKSHGKS